MDLDRQPWPERRDAAGRPPPPQRIPETQPTLLGDWFIYLSIIVLFCGIIAITALELGAAATDAVVRIPVLVGAAVLVVVSLDALVRIWRSAWAWMPVDRGRGLFRFVWAAVVAGSVVLAIGAFVLMLVL
jgi:hypothetical protein